MRGVISLPPHTSLALERSLCPLWYQPADPVSLARRWAWWILAAEGLESSVFSPVLGGVPSLERPPEWPPAWVTSEVQLK